MSSIINSQIFALATAMAISGTVIFAVLCRQNSNSTNQTFVDQNSKSNPQELRSCISSDKKRKEKKNRKKVHFADELVEVRNGEDIRRKCIKSIRYNQGCQFEGERERGEVGIPNNHTALYRGILRDRFHRTMCSY